MPKLHTALIEPPCVRAERHYQILGTPPEEAFDRLSALAADVFGVPMTAIGFHDCERIWLKSSHGLDVRQLNRSAVPFSVSLVSGEEWRVRELERSRERADALHRAGIPWQWAAAAPIVCPEGNSFGEIWLLDVRPRALDREGKARLRQMAELVRDLLELRKSSNWVLKATDSVPPLVEGASTGDRPGLPPRGVTPALTQLTDELKLAEEKFFKALRSSSILMAVSSLSGRLIEVNQVFLAVTGYRSDEVIGRSVSEIELWEDLAERQRMVDCVRQDGVVRDFIFHFRTKQGELRVGSLSAEMLFLRGEECMVSSVRDVTDAHRDPLTGLLNHASFLLLLRDFLRRAAAGPEHAFAVLYLDLDRFKVVNESLGRSGGDDLLRLIGQCLCRCVDAPAHVARLGGDEFALVLEGGLARATEVAERLLRALAAPLETPAGRLFTTASLGIVADAEPEGGASGILRDAGLAMHEAKNRGGARWVAFERGMRRRAHARLRIETELRQAVERNELELLFQPLVRASGGGIRAFEALLRWRHPEHGRLETADFVRIAEETGLIVPIGSWVLREACRRASSWQKATGSGAAVTVNLSALQIAESDLPILVAEALSASRLAAESLWLELTESVFLENRHEIGARLVELRETGVRLCLDDFGTGYSSMDYLAQFPMDVLKISRRFVLGISTSRYFEIVRTVTRLAHDLGLEVVAEGVETEAQLADLARLGCDYIQGFLTGRPREAEDVARLLAGSTSPGQGS